MYMAEQEQYRRMLLKVSTSVMISIVGPASAWNVGEENGLFLYILIYMISKYTSSVIASKNTSVAIFSYRNAPLLLVISGILSFLPNSIVVFGILMPILLGSYEGSYWAVYFDYKPWFKKIPFADPLNAYVASESIGISKPLPKNFQDAKLTSVPFAICQFVLQNSMRIVALQRGVLWLGILVVIAELSSYIVVLIYRKITEKSSSIQDIQRRLWITGQIVVLLGITSMVVGHSVELFSVFLIGWLVSQGSARGCLRKIEIQWSQNHLTGKELEGNRNPELERFQRNEVIAAVLGVAMATYLKLQNHISLDPAMVGSIIALLAFIIKFPKITFDLDYRNSNKEIGLRERLKFRSHFFTCLFFIAPAVFLSSKVVVLILLVYGFAMSIVAVVWSTDYRAIPS